MKYFTKRKILLPSMLVLIFLTAVILFFMRNGLEFMSGEAVNLLPPTSLAAQAASSTQITLSWVDTNTQENGYSIEQSLSATSGFSAVGKVGKNTTNYLAGGLAPQTTYYFRAQATGRNNSHSAYSNIASSTTLALPTVFTSTPPPTTTTTTGSGSSCPNYAGGKLPRDLWTWNLSDGSSIVTNATARSAFFSFADAHAIRTIYLESEDLIQQNQPALASFINEANTHCMGVELLFGNAQWTYTANQSYAVNLANLSVSFTNGLTGTKPLGVHYDVEPYTLPEWSSTSTSNDIANQYLDLLEKLDAVTKGTSLKLNVDVPFWYDTCSKCTIIRNGQTLNMSNGVIDRVDQITIEDYRDTSSLIISYASGEISYAKTTGKKVTIGINTKCGGSDPTYTTFCEEGAAIMDQALTDVNNNYSSNSAYAGVAVHDYAAYSILGP